MNVFPIEFLSHLHFAESPTQTNTVVSISQPTKKLLYISCRFLSIFFWSAGYDEKDHNAKCAESVPLRSNLRCETKQGTKERPLNRYQSCIEIILRHQLRNILLSFLQYTTEANFRKKSAVRISNWRQHIWQTASKST